MVKPSPGSTMLSHVIVWSYIKYILIGFWPGTAEDSENFQFFSISRIDDFTQRML